MQMQAADIRAEHHVLEVGCGWGGYLGWLQCSSANVNNAHSYTIFIFVLGIVSEKRPAGSGGIQQGTLQVCSNNT